MTGVKSEGRSLRRGLFAKYVAALVGLVVLVLAVNGAIEIWINYRATKTALIAAMGDKAEATAGRIEQSVSELERQISWVTRASAVSGCRAPRSWSAATPTSPATSATPRPAARASLTRP